MMCLFVMTNMLLVIKFSGPVAEKVVSLRRVINSVLLVACVMYIAFNLLLWRMNLLTGAAAVGLIILTGLSWNILGHTYEFFCTAVAALLALVALRRDYRMILKIFLYCHVVTMIVAAAGLYFGYSERVYKVFTSDVGESLGLIYPNHVGRMAFLIFVIAWYLWGQEKRILTLVVSWVLAAVMWTVIKCKTIALFFIMFPVFWLFLSFVVHRSRSGINENIEAANEIHESHSEGDVDRAKPFTIRRFFCCIGTALVTAMPFLAMGITYLLGLCRNFFLAHWHYGQGMYALLMRFISAGIMFKAYGFPLLGRRMEERSIVLEVTNEKGYLAAIVDNAYIFYLIAIGGIALIACMLWLSYGNYKALKRRDYALLLISFFMCGYGLIEAVYFQFEHNFLWFYPLAAAGVVGSGNSNTEKTGMSKEDDPADEASERDMPVDVVPEEKPETLMEGRQQDKERTDG